MRKIFWNLFFLLNLGVIVFFWLSNSGSLFTSGGSGDIFIAFGRITGLLAEYLILLQLILISRFSLIEREYGFDKLNRVHRSVGFFMSIFILAHPILIIIGYARRNNDGYLHQFLNFTKYWDDILPAVFSVLIIIFTGIVSIKAIKSKIPYEVWYFLHLPLYLAVGLAFGHQVNSGDMSDGGALYYWYILNYTVFGILILWRFVKPLYKFFYYGFKVEKVVRENSTVCTIYITGRNMEKYQYRAGQFANLIFLQKGLWFHHPFSYSSSPSSEGVVGGVANGKNMNNGNVGGKSIRFSVKASGDFTSKIDQIKVGTRVWVEGPLGNFVVKDDDFEKAPSSKYLFIAGGIGITPIYSLLESMKGKSADAVLMYSGRTEEDLVFKKDIEMLTAKNYFFITYDKEGKESGRMINLESIKECVPDYNTREIYICGPVKMMEQITNTFLSVGIPKKQIHFEKFGY